MPSFISKTETENIKRLFLIYLGISLLFSTITYGVMETHWWHNFLMSQLFVGVSILSLSFTVWLFFLKKNIALLTGVIVLKWPILIYVVFKATKSVKLEAIPFSLGLAPLLISALIWSFLQKE